MGCIFVHAYSNSYLLSALSEIIYTISVEIAINYIAHLGVC